MRGTPIVIITLVCCQIPSIYLYHQDMIIDNKTITEPRLTIKSVWAYLHKYTQDGNLNIVTGFFTISALCLLKKFEKEPKKFRLILGEIASKSELHERIINIISGDTSISQGSFLKR